jgi:dUTP pyrophosphatase
MPSPVLRIEVTDTDVLAEFYVTGRRNHLTDSGFDLVCPATLVIPARTTVFVDLGVRTMREGSPCGYYLYPRSSLSKTPLRLANSVGIIDAGYRGTLKAAVDNTSDTDYTIRRGDRLFQICMPTLEPFAVLFAPVPRDTERGEGGFGSTSATGGQIDASGTVAAVGAMGTTDISGWSPSAIEIARGAGMRDPSPHPFSIHYHYTYCT